MFRMTRWNSSDDVFNFQREVDRLFNQFWSDLPTRTAAGSSPSFQVNATDDGWRVDVPLPGIDPKDVSLEVAGNNLTFEGPARFQYDLDDAGKVKANSDGTISVAWWLLDEHGDWQPWMENTFTRLRD